MNRHLVALMIALAVPSTPLLAAPAAAQSTEKTDLGVAVGSIAPEIFGVNQSGQPVSFDSLKGENGLVIAFFRSADWCPYCKGQLKDLNAIAADLETKGYPLVALSYDSAATLDKFHTKNDLSYTLISDEDSSVIDAFGIRNDDVRKSKKMNGIPHPAIFIIGADKQIKAKFYEEGFKNRPETEIILSAVNEMK